ncbi:MAG: YceI family protein [Verrucomicrobiaceae bacterium]|nr:MAG: YceI family protein [Verrucomicrobiaceae bacterium]
MKPTSIIIALAVPVLFTACENPADKTESASVKEAVEGTAATTDGGTRYVFTENSTVNFVGSKVTGSHSGGFKTVTGHFSVKDGALSGNDHQVSIDMNSAWSDDEKLTGHLKSPDFFDVEKFPQSTFVATALTKTSDTSYEVAGNFTLHGVTKNISFPATVTSSGDLVKIDAKFDINRQDFGVVYPGKAEDLIRNEVVIELKLEVKAGA